MSSTGNESAKEARILDAALRLFAQQSYHAVSVPSIADAAGVGVGSIYRMADSKADLAERVFEHVAETLIEEVCLPVVVPDDISQEVFFWTYWHRLSKWARTSPHFLRFLLLHSFVGPRRLSTRLEEIGPLRVLLEIANKKGWLSITDFRLSISLLGGSLALLVLDCEDGSDLSEANLELLGEAVLRAVMHMPDQAN